MRGNIAQLMQQAQKMQENLQKAQEEIAGIEATGSAGGGMVSIVMTAKGEPKRVKIDPSLVNPAEVEVLEDLISAAMRDARSKADAYIAEEMGKVTGGLPLPPGFKLPF